MDFASQVASSDYWKVFFNTEHHILVAQWQENMPSMSDDIFKVHLQEWIALLKKYQAKRFLVDSQRGHLIMNVELQAWHDANIAPQYLEIGIEKIAFVLSEDFFQEVFLELTFSEEKAQNLYTKFFNDYQKGYDWLLKEV